MSLEDYDKRAAPDFTQKSADDVEAARQRRIDALSREDQAKVEAIRRTEADKERLERKRLIEDTEKGRRARFLAEETRRQELQQKIKLRGENQPLTDAEHQKAAKEAEKRLKQDNARLETYVKPKVAADTAREIDAFLDRVSHARLDVKPESAAPPEEAQVSDADRQAPSPGDDNAGLSGNERRALLQSRHFDEQIELDRRHDRERLAQFERLAAAYDTKVYQEELEGLEGKFIKLPRHRKQIQALHRTIADAASSHQEACESVTSGQAIERTDLLARQAQERLELEQEIAALPEAVRVSEAEREAQARLEQAAQERALLRQEQREGQGAD